MKQNIEMKTSEERTWISAPPPPPPPLPPLPRYYYWRRPASSSWSATNEEIARFWRQKKIKEEDHFLAAIKAAARIRARNMDEEDYRKFEESLNEDEHDEENKMKEENNKMEDNSMNKEIRVGIKDWWTKSKYAYLNQPTEESMKKPKKTSTYVPNNLFFYKPLQTQLPVTSFGVY
ncbi:hypothetical protein MKW94_007951 [Papaver nudicaule]|uniref:Uncharacterized protein n=1 Tax=Papaver nudicaule TaxID=74823 RepID=A0AA41SF04_PAPNU|nr:hypothetical protein [Papaver nudicaule]